MKVCVAEIGPRHEDIIIVDESLEVAGANDFTYPWG